MKNPKIRIAIVDDHTLFRNGVAALMREFDDLQVLFEADNGYQLQQMITRHPLPQVILMDINMPVLDGYGATTWLKANHPTVKVLALSMFEDDKAVIQMLKCGACGYLLKESGPREVHEAIKVIAEKGMYMNDLVSSKMVRSLTNTESVPVFSKNEAAFIELCCTELTYKEIADQMFISPRTVDNYREALFQKLNLKSRIGLVLYAIQNDMVKL
ncbi:response regulator transcription factor [Mucilaginibacter sp.]|uniref:response regulator transcription factor n=1 Tax=Mucilaginibacter sp. TaxID=1882438 RepID=UPI00260E9B2C|nr:response regulator transcription factor [Mucilaginibacter sp.]MDB5031569.1 response regulator transcription factor [Mucilaginibacter sp.]